MTNKSDDIRDNLTEYIFLENPRILITEYIPFGRNHIFELNKTLDSMKRAKSSLLTSYVDAEPGETCIEVEVEKTRIEVKDFTETGWIEFEAEVFYTEETGIEQLEKFGVHVDEQGLITYGAHILDVDHAVRDSGGIGPARVSLDKLSSPPRRCYD